MRPLNEGAKKSAVDHGGKRERAASDPLAPVRSEPGRRRALIACRVLEAEIGALLGKCPPVVRQEWFALGLHDAPVRLHEQLAAAIARMEADPDVDDILLAYGLCGRALVGLAPARCRLIVPRAHDCVTLFLGNRERYAEIMAREPGTYWYSPGWNRERRVPGPDRTEKLRREYAVRFWAEEVEALLEADREALSHHGVAGYVDHGLPGDDAQEKYARTCAAELGWRFERHVGDPSLVRDLLEGRWDDGRFLVVRPGERIAHAVDERVIRAEPASVIASPATARQAGTTPAISL